MEALTKAFELFSEETARLEGAYKQLKKEFRTVNAKLSLTTNTLKSILTNISQGIIFIDLNGKITTFNPAAEKILGISYKSVLTKPFSSTFDDHLLGFSIKKAFTEKIAPEISYATVTHKDNSKKELEAWATFTEKGLIVVIRDITQLRYFEQAANRNDRMKELGEMAASVAHEIRNPLGGIKGFAALLARDLKEDQEKSKLANYIVEGTEVLNRLVTNVLNYSRPIDLTLTSVDLGEVVNSIVEMVKVDDNFNKNITVTNHTPTGPLPPTCCDKILIQSSILNLVVNAIHSMPEGGEVSIQLSTNSGSSRIKVSDSGCGIPEENLEKIFSPFFTTKPDGNGFGLTEVYKIVQAHVGEIEVNSKVNEGTTFTISLPLRNIHSNPKGA